MNDLGTEFRGWWKILQSRKRRRLDVARISSFPVEFGADLGLRWVIAMLPLRGPVIRIGLRKNGDGVVLGPEKSSTGTALPEALAAELFVLLELHFPAELGDPPDDELFPNAIIFVVHRRRVTGPNEFVIVACHAAPQSGRLAPAQRLLSIICAATAAAVARPGDTFPVASPHGLARTHPAHPARNTRSPPPS